MAPTAATHLLVAGLAAASALSLDVPSTIVGGGRIGNLLLELGVQGDALVRRGEPMPTSPSQGPIYVCTRNDGLASVVAATPVNLEGWRVGC